MLGSAQDAEDALQDALLRAWRGLDGFQGRSSLRSWLYSIATNVCLRALERRGRRLLPPGRRAGRGRGALAEPFGDVELRDERPTPDARYEERESVELAFVAALQHLPPRQRAVLVLRDVLGFAPAEIAASMLASPAAVSSALQRAHAAVEEGSPSAASRPRCARWATRGCGGSSSATSRPGRRPTSARSPRLLTEDASSRCRRCREWFRGAPRSRVPPRPAVGRGRAAGATRTSVNGRPSAVREVAGDIHALGC